MGQTPAHLGRVKDPSSLIGLCNDRPDPDITPVIVGHYDVTPEGGKLKHPGGPWEWCCHCQSRRHWIGFIVADFTGRKYMIGSECGAKHYGGDNFQQARNRYKDVEQSRMLDRRLRRIQRLADAALSEIQAVVSSAALASIDHKRREIEAACPDAVTRLANSVRSGNQLWVPVPARGLKGAGFAPKNIGHVEGSAVIFHDIRHMAQVASSSILDALRVSLSDSAPKKSSALRAVTTAIENLQKSLAPISDAHRFFGRRNARRLERWSDQLHRFLNISVSPDGIIFASTGKPAALVRPIEPLNLPEMKICADLISPLPDFDDAAILSDTAGDDETCP